MTRCTPSVCPFVCLSVSKCPMRASGRNALLIQLLISALYTLFACLLGFLTNFLFFGRPFVKRFAVCYRTVVLSVLSVCNVGVLWPNGWMDQDATSYGGSPRPRRHCVRWGPNSSEIGTAAPLFSADVYCGQTVGHLSYC